MGKVFNKEAFEQKKNEAKAWLKAKATDARVFYYNHREELIIVVPAVRACIGGIGKAVNKHHTMKEYEKLQKRHIYDRSAGHYWVLKKEPSTAQWNEIDRRRRNGEPYYNILVSMGLIK